MPVRGIKNREIEFKYDAGLLSQDDFISRILKVLPDINYEYASGHDQFYGSVVYPRAFWRHRTGYGVNQLTYKEKIHKNDSFIRIEHNIDLSDSTTSPQVDSLLSDLGFAYNMTLFKKTWIFKTNKYLIAYYVCYEVTATSLREIGRFVEIEVCEHFPWKSQSAAYSALCKLERKFQSLGISKKRREKKSLWEMYRK